MPRLIAALVRHGEYRQLPHTPSAHQPFSLTPTGRSQAEVGGQTLSRLASQHGLQLHAELDCSRLLRAWQTADILAGKLQPHMSGSASLHQSDALAERGLGIAANLTVSQIEAVLADDPRYQPPPQDWKSNSHYRLPLPGAESLLQAGERVAAHLQSRMSDLAQQVSEDTLKVFVGHGAAFRHAAHHLGVLSFVQIAQLSMHHAVPVLLEYQENGKWRHFDGEWKVREARSAFTD